MQDGVIILLKLNGKWKTWKFTLSRVFLQEKRWSLQLTALFKHLELLRPTAQGFTFKEKQGNV